MDQGGSSHLHVILNEAQRREEPALGEVEWDGLLGFAS